MSQSSLSTHPKLVAAAAAAVATLGIGSAMSSATAAPERSPGAVSQAVFNGVAAVSANDVWVVGTQFADTQTTYAQHWDGSAWTRTATPNPHGTSTASLTSVAAVSAKDVWAGGFYQDPTTSSVEPLAAHWNGKAWKSVAVPQPANAGAFYGIGASGASDVWAVGEDQAGQGLAEHWNGKTWSIVSLPTPAGASGFDLTSVSAASATDAWAAGWWTPNGGGTYEPLAMHWDGTAWTIASPKVPSGASQTMLVGVDEVSPTQVVAVGNDVVDSVQAPLVEVWNGTKWKQQSAPTPSGATSIGLSSVAAVSATDIWAVGTYADASFDQLGLIEHWDGSAWTIVPGPKSGGAQLLTGVAATSSKDAWAAGWSLSPTAVTEHWNGKKWAVR